jgi:hypothetical protein
VPEDVAPSAPGTDIGELRELELLGEWDRLIDGVRERVRDHRRTLTDPWVKVWCGRRWRSLFISAAAADPEAVEAATESIGLPGTDLRIGTGRDRRPERQRVAERFLKRVAENEWRDELPPARIGERLEATLVLCPGLINSMLPVRAFQRAFPALVAERGWRVLAADAHPLRGCEANVADLLAAIERGEGLDHDYATIAPDAAEPPGDVFLVCYSKGAADALTMLARHPETAERVKALYLWGGAVGGSFLADSIYDAIKDLDLSLGPLGGPLKTLLQTISPLVQLGEATERLGDYDIKAAVRDLTTLERAGFLAEHAEQIDALDLPIFNITAATSALEVPYFQAQGYFDIRRIGGDPDNDMQLTQAQARMTTPMATDLAVLHAHHWDISYDPFPHRTRLGAANLDHRFPRRAALEAIFELTAELGLIESDGGTRQSDGRARESQGAARDPA